MATAKKGKKKKTASKVEKASARDRNLAEEASTRNNNLAEEASKEDNNLSKEEKKPKKHSEKKNPSETKKKASKAIAPKTKFECQQCGKVVSNAHNLRVHEHHCKSKAEKEEEKAKANEIEAAVRRLHDEFEDQREALQKETAERETFLRDELRELKEVLRLEIQRTHHIDPPTQQIEAPPPPESVPYPPEVHEPVPMDAEPPRVFSMPDQQLKIEKIDHGSKVEHLTVPTDDIAPEPDITEPPVPKELETIEDPLPTPQEPISNKKISELVRSELEKLDLTALKPSYEPSEEITKLLDEFSTRIEKISFELSKHTEETREKQDKLSKKIDERLQELNIKRYERTLEKMSERLLDIMDEVGFGESLDVSKIPPNILEIVYEATLEHVVIEMIHTLGDQEAERKTNQALEEVRLKTSGSELFRFDGRKIITENLARSLESHLISAKQIQTTYKELLNKLLDTVPHYKAKNFRAMIKIKSQEYAVDKATVLMGEMEKLSNFAETTSHMIAALSSQLNSRAVQMEEGFRNVNTAIESKIGQEQLENLNRGIETRIEAEEKMAEEIGTLKAEIEMLRSFVNDFEKRKDPKPVDRKEVKSKQKDETAKKEEKKIVEEPPPEPEKPPIDDEVLGYIKKGASSKTAIMNESGFLKEEVEDSLDRLISEGKLIRKGTKNRPQYLTPESDFETVVKKDMPDIKEKSKAKEEPKPTPAEPKEGKPPAKKKKEPEKVITSKKETVKKEEIKEETVKEKSKKEKPKKTEEKSPAKKDEKKEKPKAAKKKEKAPPMEVKATIVSKEKEPKSEKKTEEKKTKEKTSSAGKKPSEDVKKEEKEQVEKKEVKQKEEPEPKSEKKTETPEVKKEVKDLTKEEKIVFEAIPDSGITLTNLRKSVEKDVKYTVVLRALRIIIDSELITVKTRGRHTLYHKITVAKQGKNKSKKDKKQEVK